MAHNAKVKIDGAYEHFINEATTERSGRMSASDKAKLNGIATGANKYSHPSSHPASMITQDANNRFIADVERNNWNDANNKKHEHSNKNILDAITSTLTTAWNNAASHISDAVRHITANERTLWNTVSSKVDKASGKGLSTNDYTTNEKSKLSGIATGAEVNTISVVQKNGTTVSAANKIVNITVPTKLSELTNDSGFKTTDTTYNAATTSVQGLMSAADKSKLNGIATGAEVNQNTFSKVVIGSTTIEAEAKTDTLTLAAGSNITLTADTANDKITIASTNTTYSVATTSANGLMSSADKSKLNGIATGAQVNTVTSVAGRTGAITLSKSDVALGNVDNTADSSKNVASAVTASKLAATRTITIAGQMSGSTSFDGSKSITITLASNPTEIPDLANLNNYTVQGEYYCSKNTTAATLSNCPVAVAFALSIKKHAGVIQELTTYATNNPVRYMRNYYNGTWGNWYEIYHSGNIPIGYGN